MPVATQPHRLPDRVLLYGVTGSGKTTLAAKLSDLSGLPWHSVDDLTWEPNWRAVPLEEQRRRIQERCSTDKWILDTAYGSWVEIPLARAELIVALDYPRWVSMMRLLNRTCARALDKRPICNGNHESLANAFSRESILLWHFRSFARKRQRIRTWEAAAEGPPVFTITSLRELQYFLKTLKDQLGDREDSKL